MQIFEIDGINFDKEDSILEIKETSSESFYTNKPLSEVWQYVNKNPKNWFCKYSEYDV
ncbi:16645_t:CDS:1, partial [Cetraspora pellucida]